MKKFKTTEVFVPGGMPEHTYVPRTARKLEERLSSVKDNLCKLVTLTGMTKSGKTVLALRVLPRDECVWVDGGTVNAEDDLWNSILQEIDGFTEVTKEKSRGTSSAVGGKLDAAAGLPLFVHARGELSAEQSRGREELESKSRSLSPRSAAISQLRKSKRAVVIDDFHYLNRPFQANIIRGLKPLVFEGLPVVLIAIPHRKYDAVKVEREMTGRLDAITIPAWDIDELLAIPEEGFSLLNIEVAESVKQRLASEAYGSPHLMQEFCRELARSHGVEETADAVVRVDGVFDELFTGVAEGTGKIIFDKLAAGPRQRTDRIPRPLKAGGQVDIYKATLLALAHLRPGLETIEYEDIRTALREILTESIPQAHEISRVLEKMAEIAAGDEASTPVLDWERDEQKLHITDPFFAFFLKWGVEGINKALETPAESHASRRR
jgi:hypothetical protein